MAKDTKVTPKYTIYIYEGKNSKGKTFKGSIAAENAEQARAILRKQNLIVTKITAKSKPLFRLAGFPNAEDITLLTRQLATMTASGIALVQSLDIIIEGIEKEGFKKIMIEVKQAVEGGTPLSQALLRHPKHFDELFASLVAAGEESGNLDAMLDRIAIYKEKTESLKRKIKKALYYPVIVLIVASIITVILLLKVVPTFRELFAGFGADLPGFTQFVLNISDFLRENFITVFGAIIGAIITLFYLHKNNINFKHAVQRKIFIIPVFGSIMRKAIIARMARTLSTTFAAGVPLPQALESVAKSCGNIEYYDAIMQIREGVSNGQPIRTAMAGSGLFPNLVTQMVGIGEETGSLESMLAKIATIYEEEVDTSVDGLTSLLEPFIMVFLGIVVGGLVVAMYLPIFKLGSVV